MFLKETCLKGLRDRMKSRINSCSWNDWFSGHLVAAENNNIWNYPIWKLLCRSVYTLDRHGIRASVLNNLLWSLPTPESHTQRKWKIDGCSVIAMNFFHFWQPKASFAAIGWSLYTQTDGQHVASIVKISLHQIMQLVCDVSLCNRRLDLTSCILVIFM